MTPSRSLLALALVASLAVACKPTGADGSGGPTASSSSSPASASASPRAARVAKPLKGTDVKAVRCDLAAVPAPTFDASVNAVGATRHLHLGPDGSLYFFPDFRPPMRLEPTSQGCGYRLGGPVSDKKDAEFGLEPDGSIIEVAANDPSPKTKCRVKALEKLRYGHGRLLGTRFIYRDQDDLMEVDLARDDCEPKELHLPELPAKDGSAPFLGLAGGDLLVEKGRRDWKYSREILRYDVKGNLVKRYGAAEGKAVIEGDADGCGDGLCTSKGYSVITLHDGNGERVATVPVAELSKLDSVNIEGVVDVPDKGVYVLFGYYPIKGKSTGRAELVRLDGVY